MAKPEELSDRIRQHAAHIRAMPETQKTLVQFEEDDGEPQRIQDSPSHLRLENAGNTVRRLLRLGCFKEDAEGLTREWNRGGGRALWRDLVRTLRARAALPYAATFAEDCELVAKTLEKESQTITALEGEWSTPMSKKEMMARAGINSLKTFNAWAKTYGLKEAGNRQTFIIRLDKMDARTRRKFEEN